MNNYDDYNIIITMRKREKTCVEIKIYRSICNEINFNAGN